MWIKSHESEVISIELNKSLSKLQFPHAWPRFSGDPVQFQIFWELFNSSIHTNNSLDVISKFLYLKILFTGMQEILFKI